MWPREISWGLTEGREPTIYLVISCVLFTRLAVITQPIIFNPHQTHWMKYNYPHIVCEVVKAQRSGVTNLSSDLSKWETWDSTHVCLTLIPDPTLLTHPDRDREAGICWAPGWPKCIIESCQEFSRYPKLGLNDLPFPKSFFEKQNYLTIKKRFQMFSKYFISMLPSKLRVMP